MEKSKLNPELMVGDEIMVVSTEGVHDFGAPELYKPYVVVGIKHGTTMNREIHNWTHGEEDEEQTPDRWDSPEVQRSRLGFRKEFDTIPYTYYQIEPIGMTDEERTGAMLAGGGRMKPMYIFPSPSEYRGSDQWILRPGFLRGEHLTEHKESGLNPELEVGDEILVVDNSGTPRVNLPELYLPYVVEFLHKPNKYQPSDAQTYYSLDLLDAPDLETAVAEGIRIKDLKLYPQHRWIFRPGFRRGELNESTSKVRHEINTAIYTDGKVPNVVRHLPTGWSIWGWKDQNNINKDTKYQDDLIRTKNGYIGVHWINGAGKNQEWNDWLIRTYFFDEGENDKWLIRLLNSWELASNKTPDQLIYKNEKINKAYTNKEIDFTGWAFGLDNVEKQTSEWNTHHSIQDGFDELNRLLNEQVDNEDYGIVDGEKLEKENEEDDWDGGTGDGKPFTTLETRILNTLHKYLTKAELGQLSRETPETYRKGSGAKFWDVMKMFGIEHRNDVVDDTRASKYAKWALDNWTEDGDYGSIEQPIKTPLKWYEIDRSESGSQIEYKDGTADVLGFDEDDASDRADYDFYSWGGDMETTDWGDYESYDSQIDRVDFKRIDESITSQMGYIEIQDLLFNFWLKVGPTLEPDKLKLIGFDMHDNEDRRRVLINLVEYYGDEELMRVIVERLEGVHSWEYEYTVTNIDIRSFDTYPIEVMVDVMVNGDQEVPVTTADDGIIDITLWDANEKTREEWQSGGPGPYDNLYEEVRDVVLNDVSILLKNLPVEPMLDYVDFSEPGSFDGYVKEPPELVTEDEGYIDDMVYIDEPREKHIRRMGRGLGSLVGFPLDKYKNMPPPENESDTTEEEIEYLEEIPVDKNLVDSADEIRQHFKNFLSPKGLEYPKEEMKEVMQGVKAIILILKYHYNRPRPWQIAQAKGLELNSETLQSSSSPSYPSGHATQGRFVARYLSDIYPEYRDELMQIGDDIAFSRNMAKVHYPSDSAFGKLLGDDMYEFTNLSNINEDIKRENYYLDKSDIHGQGVFANKDFEEHEEISKLHTIRPDGGYDYEELARFHNHSDNPNCINTLRNNTRYLNSLKPIRQGEELTTDYRLQADLEQPEDFDVNPHPLHESIPQPGSSSAEGFDDKNLPYETEYLTLDEILSRVKNIAYYKEVLRDLQDDKDDWPVTQTVKRYADYWMENPESITGPDFPPIQVIGNGMKDGSHRISTLNALANNIDIDNPYWKEVKLEVRFYEPETVMDSGHFYPWLWDISDEDLQQAIDDKVYNWEVLEKWLADPNAKEDLKKLRGESLNEQTHPGLNPDLEEGAIIRVIDVDGEHANMPKRFGVYEVKDVRQDNATQEMYYALVPYPWENLPDTDYVDHLIAHYGDPRTKYLYWGDTWMYADVERKTISEHEETGLNPELEVGDTIRIIDRDREVENNTLKYNIPLPEVRPEMFVSYEVVDKESNGHKSKWPWRYTLVPEGEIWSTGRNPQGEKTTNEKLLYPWIYQWIYADIPMATGVDRKTLNEHKEELNQPLTMGDVIRVVDVDKDSTYEQPKYPYDTGNDSGNSLMTNQHRGQLHGQDTYPYPMRLYAVMSKSLYRTKDRDYLNPYWMLWPVDKDGKVEAIKDFHEIILTDKDTWMTVKKNNPGVNITAKQKEYIDSGRASGSPTIISNVLDEQVMMKKGDMLKSDIFKFLSNRFALTSTDYSEIKDNNGNYYRLIDMEEPYDDVNLSHLLNPVVDFVSSGINSGTFEEEDIEKGLKAVTDWISLAMNQKKDLMN